MIIQVVITRAPDNSLRIAEMSAVQTARTHHWPADIGPGLAAQYIEKILINLVPAGEGT